MEECENNSGVTENYREGRSTEKLENYREVMEINRKVIENYREDENSREVIEIQGR
jgi:ribosome biogenesis protein Tsr3